MTKDEALAALEKVDEGKAFLAKLRKDYISTVLAARIPGWQNLDDDFDRLLNALSLLPALREDIDRVATLLKDKISCLSFLQDKFDSLYVTMKIIEQLGDPDDEAVSLAKQALSEIEVDNPPITQPRERESVARLTDVEIQTLNETAQAISKMRSELRGCRYHAGLIIGQGFPPEDFLDKEFYEVEISFRNLINTLTQIEAANPPKPQPDKE